MDFRLVPGQPVHLDQLEAIERACFSDPWSRKLLAELLALENAHTIAAVDGSGTVLGYASLQTVLDEGYVNNLAVLPAHRRRGIASALLGEFRRYGEERELAFLTLEVRASNAAALALYAKHGYAQAGRRKNYYTHPREDAILMTLEFVKHETGNPDPGRTEESL